MATCYRQVDGGTISAFSGVTQCSNSTSAAGYTPCCFNGDLCLEDSLCYNANPGAGGDPTGYYEALCSDSSFRDSSCSHKCTAFTKGDAVYNSNDSIWNCCGADANGDPNCGDPTTVTFSAPAPSVLLAEATGSASSTSSATTSPTSGTSTVTSSATGRGTSATSSSASSTGSAAPGATSTSSPSSGLSSGAAAGIGIGGAVIAISIIGLIFWFLMQRRRRQRNLDPASKPLSDQWQGHGSLPPYEKSPSAFNAGNSPGISPAMSPAQRPLAYAEMGESDVKPDRHQVVHELAS